MTTTTNPLPETHAARRPRDYRAYGTRMIGRLVEGEFDRLDAIVANTRIGIAPTLRAVSVTLAIDEESMSRRLYVDRVLGLLDMEQIDEITGGGGTIPIYAFVPSTIGARLFNEALALMDRGLVAA